MKANINRVLLVCGLLLGGTSSAFATGDAFKPEFVSSLSPAYLQVQAALAADDLAASQTAARTLLATAKTGPDLADFTNPVQAIVDATTIDAARTGFSDASQAYITLIKQVGTTGDLDLYVAHCPMAFDGKGGDWLQTDKKIANPYFGAAMLRCGSIKRQVAKHESKMSGDRPATPGMDHATGQH